jgi:hypothetical protein
MHHTLTMRALLKAEPSAIKLLLTMTAIAMLCGNPGGLLQAAEMDAATTVTPSRWQWLEGTREQMSRGVTALGRNIDDWLAGESISEETNETFLRLRLQQQLGSLNGYHSKFKVGGSLDLPRTSERWKLIFESDNQELNSLQDNILGENVSGETTGGFRYLQVLTENWELSHDVGLRGRLPVDPYYRTRARFQHALGDVWSFGFSQKLWYYRTDGWGYDTDVKFSRPLGADKVLDVSSNVKYQQSRKQKEFAQSVTIHQSLAELRTLSYSLGLVGISEPNIRVSDYYVESRYRRAIREDWLFLELAPQIIVSRDENWRPEPRLLLNLEMLFFDFQ